MRNQRITDFDFVGRIVTSGGFVAVAAVCAAFFMQPSWAERYVVKYKNAASFRSISTDIQQQKDLLTRFGHSPLDGGVAFLNTSARATSALNNLEMVIIEAPALSAGEFEKIASHPAIEFIEREHEIPAPPQISSSWGAYKTLASPLRVETPWGINAVHAPEAWSVTKGEGVRVVVLDTGLDKDHPALAANFELGQDFVGDKHEGPYPFFDLVGHGTHVSGTILADGDTTGLVGVAPRARLYMGRVCGAASCMSGDVLAGVNWAIEMKAHVVNLSLGSPLPALGERVAYEKAEQQGVVVVAASGNSAASAVMYPSKYSTVFAVGAVDANLQKATFSNYGPELDVVAPGVDVVSSVPLGSGRESQFLVDLGEGSTLVPSTGMEGSAVASENVTGLLAYAGLGKPADIAAAKLGGKIAFIQRGEITFAEKAKNAVAAGAIGVVVFNNEPGVAFGGLGEDVPVPVIMIEQSSGQSILGRLNAGHQVEAAVGINPSDYASFPGTSMASPHVAGVVALVRAANLNLSPAQVRQIIMDTATALEPNEQNQTGHGIVNAEAAVQKARAN